MNAWAAVDAYITDRLVPSDPDLDRALKTSAAAGLPAISVSPAQGKLLSLLARTVQARSILEIGALGGYSAIWMARTLPIDGVLVTLEIDPRHAEVARANIEAAGLERNVDLRVGPALETLSQLRDEGLGPFDFTFIDADKKSSPEYFQWAVKLSRKGSLIVVDNVVRDGAVLDGASRDESVQGIRRLYDVMGAEKRVSVTAIQTVGVKGYDGFAIALVG